MRYCDRLAAAMKFDDGYKDKVHKGICLAVLLLGMVLLNQFMDYRATKEKYDEMAIELEAYSKLAAKVNDSAFRAVQVEQVPMVLEDVVQMGKDYGLVVNAKDKALYQDDTASIYEISIKGSWKRTAMYLENMQAKDALFNLCMLDMRGTDENLETVLQLKIYTK